MTHVSINVTRQRWWMPAARRTQDRHHCKWNVLTDRLTALFRPKGKDLVRRASINKGLDQLSDHELKDIGLSRDNLDYPNYLTDKRTLRDLQYHRFRRLPGE